jgi:hypothetical protein
MSTRRTSLALGATGLAAGLALGITGFARAADPTPSPSTGPDKHQLRQGPGHPWGPKGHFRGDHRGGADGLVTAIDGDSLTVRTPAGTETIGLTSSTAYYEGRSKATRSAVDKGEVVHVRLVDPRASKKVAAVVTVVPAHLEGWVTKVSDDSFTVTDPSGFTRVIRTDSKTSYVKDGATSNRGAIMVGTFVRAMGSVADDGTSLDADRVATGRPGPGDGPGRMGPPMGAPGAFGGPDDAPGDGPEGDGASFDGPVA